MSDLKNFILTAIEAYALPINPVQTPAIVGHDLSANPRAAVCFFFSTLRRQVRVEGPVRRLAPADSDSYFAGRPRGHQISAAASPQSQPVASMDELRQRKAAIEAAIGDGPVPRPTHWGGYALKAEQVELWIQGDDRLHDRRLYAARGRGLARGAPGPVNPVGPGWTGLGRPRAGQI